MASYLKPPFLFITNNNFYFIVCRLNGPTSLLTTFWTRITSRILSCSIASSMLTATSSTKMLEILPKKLQPTAMRLRQSLQWCCSTGDTNPCVRSSKIWPFQGLNVSLNFVPSLLTRIILNARLSTNSWMSTGVALMTTRSVPSFLDSATICGAGSALGLSKSKSWISSSSSTYIS